MKIRIYQIEPELDRHNLIFRDFETAAAVCKDKLPADAYACVFNGDVEADSLEGLFTIFNIQHPPGYRGRSMSISDVVEICVSEADSAFYYCDSFGFKRVPFDKERCAGRALDE